MGNLIAQDTTSYLAWHTPAILEQAAEYKIWLEIDNVAGEELGPLRWHGIKKHHVFYLFIPF